MPFRFFLFKRQKFLRIFRLIFSALDLYWRVGSGDQYGLFSSLEK